MARCSRSDCRRWRPDTLVRYARVGLRVDGAWFCSPACVESATRRRLLGVHLPGRVLPAIPALRLGVLLLHQGAITSTVLGQALREQRTSGLRLGAQLQRMGAASAEDVLRGLSAQAGISYLTAIDPSCVRYAPGGLSVDEVRALGVVPIQAIEPDRLLMVACAAPLPRAALSALRQLTGWTPEPYVVSDADWGGLMRAYGIAVASSARRVEFARVRDVQDAAARVAAAAALERDITVTEAHCESSTWLRVQGPDAINTLLVPRSEENPCPVPTTSH